MSVATYAKLHGILGLKALKHGGKYYGPIHMGNRWTWGRHDDDEYEAPIGDYGYISLINNPSFSACCFVDDRSVSHRYSKIKNFIMTGKIIYTHMDQYIDYI
jgi:hypothetical protein